MSARPLSPDNALGEDEKMKRDTLRKKMKAIKAAHHVLTDLNAEVNDPFGSLLQFLTKEQFDDHYTRAKELMASEARAGGLYEGRAKEAVLEAYGKTRKKRAVVYLIISDDQGVNDKLSMATFSGIQHKALRNETAVKQLTSA
jgi:hypothetical protein